MSFINFSCICILSWYLLICLGHAGSPGKDGKDGVPGLPGERGNVNFKVYFSK